MIKRRVAMVFGKWGKDTDFVLEPACSDTCDCEVCKDAIWITEVKKDPNVKNERKNKKV